MLKYILEAVWSFLATNWWCVSTFIGIGYLLGSFITRRVMAPSFCPNCLLNKRWQEELHREMGGKQKAESRRFYWLRRKKKNLEE